MKNQKNAEMWKNAFEKINEEYIAEAAEIAPSGEERFSKPSHEKGTGNFRFVLAAAAAVLVSFIGVGFFFNGTGIEPLSPSSGSIGTSNEDDTAPPVAEISGNGTMTTTMVMDENGEIVTIVSKSYDMDTTTEEVPTAANQPLTVEKLKALVSAKGKELTWSDFEQFEGQDIGSGLYIMEYPIDAAFRLVVGGVPNEKPWYIRLIYNVDEGVFSITDNGAEGFEEFVEKAGSYLTLAQLEEISEKYDISLEMLTDIEIKIENGILYHDRDKHFYPMYLVFEADNRLMINTEARLSSGDDGELISLIFEKLTVLQY